MPDICAPLLARNNHVSFIKAIPDCQYKITVHKTDSLNTNTVPLTVQFHTPDTDGSTQNVQTEEVPRDLSVLNGDAGGSSVL
jgi:hypothetical protein